jgi:predicted membrane-bound mannosyltransferase
VTAFSVFFRNWRGPLDSVLCFVNYAGRAAHYPDHIHPWYYYAGLLAFTNYHGAPVWSEAFILALAAIGAGFALFGGSRRPDAEPRFVRFLAVYSLLLAVAYSAVPYKTPWCTVQMLTPLILLAGYGATELFARAGQNRWWRLVAAGVGLAGIAHLGWQAYAASYRFPADNRNPYVYGHALRGVIDAVNWIERVAAIQPDGRKLLTQVIAGDPWPLPWYLRGFERVGYWEQPPDDLAGDVLIVDTRLLPRIEARLGDDFQVSFYGLRPGETIGVCVRRGLYDRFVESQTRERSR